MLIEFEMPKNPENKTHAHSHGMPWSKADESTLTFRFDRGDGVLSIAEELGRTATSIACKLKALGRLEQDPLTHVYYFKSDSVRGASLAMKTDESTKRTATQNADEKLE